MREGLSLNGAVAVVTGGASGIGAACCRLLTESGAEVHVIDRDGDPPVDVTDRAALERLAAGLDRLDVLVNAAGVLTENRPVDELSPDDFRRNFEVNVLGTLNACQAFASRLRAARGAVVNVASQAALVSLPQQAAYTASKGAVAALTRSLAIDWAEHGVRVNAVAPGFTVTPMTEAFFENETFTRAGHRAHPARADLAGRRDRRRDRVPRQPAGKRDHRRRPPRRRRLDGRRAGPAVVSRPRLLAGLGALAVAGGVAGGVVLAFSGSSQAAPTRAEYFARVAKICGRYGPKLDQIAPPQDVTIPGEVVTPLKRVIPLIRAETTEVRALRPPRELAAKTGHWLQLKDRTLAALEEALRAAEAPNIAGTAVAYIRFERLARETSRAGAAIGFPSICSSSR